MFNILYYDRYFRMFDSFALKEKNNAHVHFFGSVRFWQKNNICKIEENRAITYWTRISFWFKNLINCINKFKEVILCSVQESYFSIIVNRKHTVG